MRSPHVHQGTTSAGRTKILPSIHRTFIFQAAMAQYSKLMHMDITLPYVLSLRGPRALHSPWSNQPLSLASLEAQQPSRGLRKSPITHLRPVNRFLRFVLHLTLPLSNWENVLSIDQDAPNELIRAAEAAAATGDRKAVR